MTEGTGATGNVTRLTFSNAFATFLSRLLSRVGIKSMPGRN